MDNDIKGIIGKILSVSLGITMVILSYAWMSLAHTDKSIEAGLTHCIPVGGDYTEWVHPDTCIRSN